MENRPYSPMVRLIAPEVTPLAIELLDRFAAFLTESINFPGLLLSPVVLPIMLMPAPAASILLCVAMFLWADHDVL